MKHLFLFLQSPNDFEAFRSKRRKIKKDFYGKKEGSSKGAEKY